MSAQEPGETEDVRGGADDNDMGVRSEQDVDRTLAPSDTYNDVRDRSFIGEPVARMNLIAGYGGDGSDHPTSPSSGRNFWLL